jgi:hypothetical protein
VIRRSQQMASNSKKILDDTVEEEKPLGLASRLESWHLPFPLAGRLMRGFSAIVGATFRVVIHVAQDRSQGSHGLWSRESWFESMPGSQPFWFEKSLPIIQREPCTMAAFRRVLHEDGVSLNSQI